MTEEIIVSAAVIILSIAAMVGMCYLYHNRKRFTFADLVVLGYFACFGIALCIAVVW